MTYLQSWFLWLVLTCLLLTASTITFADGNVTVTVVDGNLLVEGDKKSNRIFIELEPTGTTDTFRIFPRFDSTTINGQEDVLVSGVTGGIVVILGKGNDQVALEDVFADFITITTDDGKDVVAFSDARTAGDIHIDTGNGGDLINIDAFTTIGGNLTAQLGPGADVFFNFGGGGTVVGKTRIEGDSGNDRIELESQQTFADAFHVDLGTGNDTVVVDDAAFQAKVRLERGDGTDTLVLGTDNSFAVPPKIIEFE
ncbi:MAG: hypothetical protein ACRERD_26355 [Candidatus Binatia bacterium]